MIISRIRDKLKASRPSGCIGAGLARLILDKLYLIFSIIGLDGATAEVGNPYSIFDTPCGSAAKHDLFWH